MSDMKILSVVGARPNFIKMSSVIKEIERRKHHHILVHTGQHYDWEMSGIFMKDLDLPKMINLRVGSGTHGYQTGKMLIQLEKIMMKEKPDAVLVPGDVNTTLAGALAATKLKIPLGHIEAGLRSYDREMPEEINRVLTDHCSDYLFCPTKTAVENLEKEGISKDRIFLVGDTMFDIFLQNMERALKKSSIHEEYNIDNDYFLLTIHRAENTDIKSRLKNIISAIISLQEQIIFPAHPRTVKRLREFGLLRGLKKANNVKLIKPIGYFDFLKLISQAKLVMTDSGGVQKEAFFLKIPCITLRDNTEWVETIEYGGNTLAGANKDKIINAVYRLNNFCLRQNVSLFGDGKAGRRIIDLLEEKIRR
jgi:UDP-N-acetylglucosamine 2-epimerase (non-hydrolysing)